MEFSEKPDSVFNQVCCGECGATLAQVSEHASLINCDCDFYKEHILPERYLGDDDERE